MGEFTSYQPLQQKLQAFPGEVFKLFQQAINERSVEIVAEAQKDAIARLYGQSTPLAKFAKLKFTPNNATAIQNIYKLWEKYETVNASDNNTIESLGRERGFTAEESLTIYNMLVYSKAIDNIRAQREDTVNFIVGKA